MAMRLGRALSAVFGLALSLGPSAFAQTPQTLPPAPPDEPQPARSDAPAETLALSFDPSADLHTEINRAVTYLIRHEYALARMRLLNALRASSLDPDGTSTPAVLLRLTDALRGGDLRPFSQPAAPTAPTQPGPPAPPTDEEVLARELDQALTLLTQHHAHEAKIFLQSALSSEPPPADQDAPLRVLLRLAARLDPAVSPQTPEEPVGPARPPERTDTIDAAETFVLYSLGLGYGLNVGIWADFFIGNKSPAALLAVPLLTTAGGAVGAWLFSRDGQLRRGRAYSANTGFYLGGLAGGILAADARNSFGSRMRGPAGASLELGFATAGLGLGVLIGNLTDAEPGSASFVLTGGVWGGTLGVLLSEGFSDNPFRGRRPTGLYWCLGSFLGAASAFASAAYLDMTPGRARWIDLGAMLGGIVGLFLPINNSEGSGGSPGPSALGGALGIAVGGIGTYFITGLGRESGRARSPNRSFSALETLSPSFSPLPEGGALISLRSITP